MNHSASAAWLGSATAVRITRSTPSPPMPARRSQRATTRAAARSPCTDPSGSGSSTKSFSVPWPLRKGIGGGHGPNVRRHGAGATTAADPPPRRVGSATAVSRPPGPNSIAVAAPISGVLANWWP